MYLFIVQALFEIEHNTAFLQQKKQRTTDAQYVMYEKFSHDIEKFFQSYEILPILANPLR